MAVISGKGLVQGTADADSITGIGTEAENDTLRGGAGADTLDGGLGYDYADYTTSTSAVNVQLSAGTASNDGFGTVDTLANIEAVTGSNFGDVIVGASGWEGLSGMDGDDSIQGRDGNDQLSGGRGNDQIVGGTDLDGKDSDTVFYVGDRKDFTITAVQGGGFTIADKRAGADSEGTDVVTEVELFQFGDGLFTAANLVSGQPQQPPPGSSVTGTEGNDRLAPATGTTAFDGLGGHDWVDFETQGHRGDTVQVQTDGSVRLTHGGVAYTLRGVEEVRFADGRLVFDAADPASQVLRLYEAALNRLPDQEGMNFWTTAVQGGQSLAALAEGFLASPEFVQRFGDASTANGAFVDQLYQNVLGRAGEAEGRDFWVGSLDKGAASRAEVLMAFSESAENKQGTAGLVAGGIWDRSEEAAEVARLYDTVFGRAPDAPGLVAWKEAIEDGNATLLQVADAFTNSAEFKTQYGNLANRDFADKLYVNTLDRAADQAGLDHWTSVLDSGVLSRAEVVMAFSESAEHVALTAAKIQSETPGEFGILFA